MVDLVVVVALVWIAREEEEERREAWLCCLWRLERAGADRAGSGLGGFV